jgi:hypothetical protein
MTWMKLSDVNGIHHVYNIIPLDANDEFDKIIVYTWKDIVYMNEIK